MTHTEADGKVNPHAVVVTRHFPVTRAKAYRAWTSTQHVRRWFCPDGFSVPEATVEPHPGGRFDIVMLAADGVEHRCRGTFIELLADTRLVFDLQALAPDGHALFVARTEVSFSDDHGGCSIRVVQTYTVLDPAATPMLAGAFAGWTQTLAHLEMALSADVGGEPLVRGSFRIERDYAATVGRVFQAFTDPAHKAKWFGAHPDIIILRRDMQVRPQGREHLSGRWPTGTVSVFDAVYFDVVENRRLIYAYEMHLDARKISVSLASFEFDATATGTHLTMCEDGLFLDGYDDSGSRAQGSSGLLDALGRYLDA